MRTTFSVWHGDIFLQKHERRVGDVSTRLKIALKTAGWHELWTPITQGKKQSFFPRSLLRPPSNKALSYLTSSFYLPLKAYVRDTTIFIHPAKKGLMCHGWMQASILLVLPMKLLMSSSCVLHHSPSYGTVRRWSVDALSLLMSKDESKSFPYLNPPSFLSYKSKSHCRKKFSTK